jgi:hypothetical protein
MTRLARIIGITVGGVAFLWSFAARPVTQTQSDPAAIGQWSGVQTWPIVSVHAQMLPTGRVMFYPYSDGPYLWDPATAQITSANLAGYNLFCTGHSWMADGRLFVSGGHISNEVGLPNASIYNPSTGSWTRLPDMNAGRWYPTNTTLPNGDVLVTSGMIDRTVWANPLPQVWQVASSSWRDLVDAQSSLPLYPFMFVAPNGSVFYAGPSQTAQYLNTAGRGSWTPVADSSFGLRDYGSSVMYDTGKVMIVGGGDPPTATAEIIDLLARSPRWTNAAPMSTPRRQANTTLLPDGKVLVTGGSSGAGFDNASSPVLSTELWDPATNVWTQMAPITQYRGYHSTALLLPDGRVLSSGGDDHLSAEVYSPPYLFRGARPAITSAPTHVTWGQQFQVQTPDAANIAAVSLIRLSAVTHAFNQDQRYSRLTFTMSGNALQITAPATANEAPPGPYWLFLLDGQGIPSVARLIYMDNVAPAPTVPGAPTGLTATAASATRVNLAWTDASTSEDGFTIERAPGTTTTFANVGSVAANVTTFSDLTVQASTTYTYRVRAFNTAGSAPSNTATATTPATSTDPTGRRRFNGMSDYIDFPAAPQVSTASFAFFFTPLSLPATSERDVLLTYAQEGQAEPFATHDKQLFLSSDGTLKARVWANSDVIATSSTRLTVGRRYHIGMTISSTTLRIFVDGVETGSMPAAGSFAGYGNPLLRLAGVPGPVEGGATSTRMHGDVTQFGEWTVALTAAEMASLAGGAAVTGIQPAALAIAADLTTDPPTAQAGGPLVANGTTFVTGTPTGPTLPAAPTGLSATAASATRVNLAWTDASTTEDGFTIERAPGTTTTFTDIGNVAANVTSFSDLSVQPSTTYTYRVRAFNTAGSAPSNTATATTPAATGTGQTGRRRFNGTSDYIDFPAAPQVSTASFAFFFTPLSLPAASERDVLLTYAQEGQAEPFATHDKQLFLSSDGTLKARVWANSNVIATSSTKLTVGRRYHIGMTISSTTLRVFVDGVETGNIPAAGSFAGYGNPLLRLAGVPGPVEGGTTSTRMHGDVTQFGEWTVALTAAEMASLAGGAAVTGIQPAALAIAAELTTDPPAAQTGGPLVANGTTFVTGTQTPPALPAAPTGLTATAASATRVNLAWTDASTTEDGFTIQRAPGTTTTFTDIGNVAANVTSFSDLTVQPSTTYTYRVRAFNTAGSAPSNTATATTPASTSPAGRRRFNGTSDYIDFPAAPQVSTASFAFFFTPLSLPAATERDVLLTYAQEGQTEPFSTHDKQLFLTSDGTLKARVWANSNVIATSSTKLTVGRRYHIGMTISSTTLRIFVDGVQTGSIAAAGSFAGYGNPLLRLAGRPGSLESGATSTRMHGDVTQFGEWTVALTAAEMASLAGGAAVTSVQSAALAIAADLTTDPPAAQAGGPLVANGTTFVTDSSPGGNADATAIPVLTEAQWKREPGPSRTPMVAQLPRPSSRRR